MRMVRIVLGVWRTAYERIYRYEGKCGEVLVFLSVKQKPNTHNKAKMEDVQQQIKQSRLIQY